MFFNFFFIYSMRVFFFRESVNARVCLCMCAVCVIVWKRLKTYSPQRKNCVLTEII